MLYPHQSFNFNCEIDNQFGEAFTSSYTINCNSNETLTYSIEVDSVTYKGYRATNKHLIDYVGPGNHTVVVYAKDKCDLILTQTLWISANFTADTDTLKSTIDSILDNQDSVIENKDSDAFMTACTGIMFACVRCFFGLLICLFVCQITHLFCVCF